jgi:hypothetical protein
LDVFGESVVDGGAGLGFIVFEFGLVFGDDFKCVEDAG